MFRKPLKVKRVIGKPKLENGILISPQATVFQIKASVQPLKANEMQALPEGRRTARAVKVYSDTELLTAGQNGQQADRLKWLDREYEVVASDAYQMDVISHYRAYAVEVNDH